MDEMNQPQEDAEVVNEKAIPLGSRRGRGPKTSAGKARVARNPIKHGISCSRRLVPGESSDEWETHRRAFVEDLAPQSAVETALAEHAAWAAWRLGRVRAYEEAATAERQHLEMASARLLPHPNVIDMVIRYEAHLKRQFLQALHELEAMRAERRGRPMPVLRVDVQTPTETLAPIVATTS